jgi:hypothetical protein
MGMDYAFDLKAAAPCQRQCGVLSGLLRAQVDAEALGGYEDRVINSVVVDEADHVADFRLDGCGLVIHTGHPHDVLGSSGWCGARGDAQ